MRLQIEREADFSRRMMLFSGCMEAKLGSSVLGGRHWSFKGITSEEQ